MVHPLQQQIDAVRRAARGVLLSRGIGLVVTISVAVVLAVGLLDGWLKFRDPGLRLICSGIVWGIVGWACWRYLRPAFTYQPRNVELAQGIERVQPALRGRLASAVEFLAQDEDDLAAGSAGLRRAVIAHTTSEVADQSLVRSIDRRPAQRALIAAGVALAVAFGVIVWQRGNALTSVGRLAFPFGATAWPTVNELAFVLPVADTDGRLRLARGQSLDWLVIDANGALPDDVRVEIRYPDGNPGNGTDAVKMQLESRAIVHDADGRFRVIPSQEEAAGERSWVMVARRDNLQRGFEYRAVGGDDTAKPWRRVEVLEPPRVESLKVTVQPPPYTGQLARPSDPLIRALAGSSLVFRGISTKPLTSAVLHREGQPPLAATISADHHGFVIPADESQPVVLDRTSAYWFELIDQDGVVGGSELRYEIRAIADEVPTVVLEQPVNDLFVTPAAEIPLRILAKDDLAIRNVSLLYSRTDRPTAGEAELVLAKIASAPASATTQAGDSRIAEHLWKLNELDLKPPLTITFVAAVSDFRPQSGRSAPRKLTIVSAKELEERFIQRQEYILAELARALKMQQEARAQTTTLEIQLRETGKFEKTDVDRLQSLELNQRQISRTLTSPAEGITALIESLLGDLRSNRIDSPDMQRRMESLLADLQQLGKGPLPTIERELTSALKSAQTAPAGEDLRKSPALPAAGERQDHVIAVLERWLGDLKQYDNYRRFAREIGQYRREQAELAAETEQLRVATQGREPSPQQQADLRKTAQRQTDLARRFDKLMQQMDAMQTQLRDTEPLAAETIGDAVTAARENAISNQMNEAARQVAGQQLNEAKRNQGEIGDNLQSLMDILSDQRERELSRLVKKLREAETQLQGLRKKQEGLRKKAEQAAQIKDEEQRRQELQRLAREEAQLQKELEQFARRLQRLQAEEAARTAAKGGGQAGKSSQAGQAGDAGGAAKHAAQAEKDLEEAQRQLAKRRQQAEMDLAQEEVAKLEAALKSLREREQKILEETVRLARLKQDQQRLTRPQLESLQELARVQDALREETAATAGKLSAAEVMSLALTTIAGDMRRAAEMLDRREVGPPAQQAEQDTLARLAQILDALAPDEAPGMEQPGGEDGDGGSGAGSGQDSIHSLAELKLLKLMQVDVNQRTKALDDKLSSKQNLTEEERNEYVQLAQRQGQLVELLRKLTAPTEADPEKAPFKLPDEKPKPNEKNGLLPDD